MSAVEYVRDLMAKGWLNRPCSTDVDTNFALKALDLAARVDAEREEETS